MEGSHGSCHPEEALYGKSAAAALDISEDVAISQSGAKRHYSESV